MKRKAPIVAILAVASLLLAACGGSSSKPDSSGGESSSASGDVLDRVKKAGVVRCGVRDDLPGFAVRQPDGSHEGFDVEFCKVIAAGVFGDSTKVEYIDLKTPDRFTALQSGEVDVLVRNTTWTASRDGIEGVTFLQPNFFDGQAMMVNVDSDYQEIKDMDGATVCVTAGTTTEGNIATEFQRLGIKGEFISLENPDLIEAAFSEGRCEGWTADGSALATISAKLPEGVSSVRILPERISKEPLAPAVADGDSKWAQIVNWSIMATIQAEEFGITSENVDSMSDTEDVNIRNFLGVETDGVPLNPGLGLDAKANAAIVKEVGNYGEIFDRHLTPLGVDRGLNRQYSDGGILYTPPFR